MIDCVLHHVETLLELLLYQDVHHDLSDQASDAILGSELFFVDLFKGHVRPKHDVKVEAELENPNDDHVLEVVLRDHIILHPDVLQAELVQLLHVHATAGCAVLHPQLLPHHHHLLHMVGTLHRVHVDLAITLILIWSGPFD